MGKPFLRLAVFAPLLFQLFFPVKSASGRWAIILDPTGHRCMLERSDRDRNDCIVADDIVACNVTRQPLDPGRSAVARLSSPVVGFVCSTSPPLRHRDRRVGDLALRAPPFRPPNHAMHV